MKKKIIFDMALNIISTALPTIVLQLLLLPLVAKYMSDENYGLLVTIIAFFNVVPSTMGNVLNNIRLLYDDNYKKNNENGDFNVILSILCIVNVLCTIAFILCYDREMHVWMIALTVLVSTLWLLREYYVVAFRIIISYRSILVCNVICVVGNAIGYLLFRILGCWEFIYFVGLLLSLGYCFWKSELWKEPYRITSNFKRISEQGTFLLLAKVLNRIITYADRIMLYPMLGGASVSTYYVATIFGKVISMMITPINSVALTYLSKMNTKKGKPFFGALMSGIGICIIGYVIALYVSRPILSILYPRFIDEAMKYIAITTGTTVFYTLTSIVDPFIMRFYDMKWQIAINGFTVVAYLLLGFSLLSAFGLIGFCYGALITNFCKLVFMVLIYCRCKTLCIEDTEGEI